MPLDAELATKQVQNIQYHRPLGPHDNHTFTRLCGTPSNASGNEIQSIVKHINHHCTLFKNVIARGVQFNHAHMWS